jgi:hypothetical protein
MLPRERVLTALNFQQPDRVPIYIWIFGQPGVIDDIVAKYGTFEAFCDALDVDVTQAFPAKGFLKQGATPNSPDSDYEPAYGWVYTLDAALEAEFTDPDDPDIYTTIRAEIEHHKETAWACRVCADAGRVRGGERRHRADAEPDGDGDASRPVQAAV